MIPLKDNIPTVRFPLVTVALILANAIVYFAFQHGGILHGPPNGEVVRYGTIPYELTHLGSHCGLVEQGRAIACGAGHPLGSQPPTLLTVFTAMFMHGGIIHIAGNMLFLWIFGNNVEDAMGHAKFLAFYLLGGVAAAALQVAISPDSVAPLIGASGAIAGVLGGYIVLYPRARVFTAIILVFFFMIIELPALVVLGLWFVEQAIFGAVGLSDPTGAGAGVAYFAHVGGFAFGLLAIRLFARRPAAAPAGPRYPVY